MVKQHRLVTDTLKAEIEGIHGLQVCVPPEFSGLKSGYSSLDKDYRTIINL
jgi:hypothetical protein